ncbi:phage Gp37/Gp68 family protein [Paraburkholderia sp. EG304]|uniref:phage Gp37/Gp68 family protein n=1 Tax=Paraburkholderia sp. EG304 TaxID=3237015 RepID=UPI0039796C9D
MSENSKIEWTDHTFNPWEGCQKVGPGCDHCYAETRNARFSGGTAINWGPGAPRRRTSPANWRKPLAWNAAHDEFFAVHGRRQRVFCASLADVFDNAVDPTWRRDLFNLIAKTPNLDWLLLTKRIGNVMQMISETAQYRFDLECIESPRLPDNVWLGATVVNQAEADRDIPKLLAVPARVRFLSMEPLLGPVNLWLPTRTWTNSAGDTTCDHCCNGDRCDDPTHYERGMPEWRVRCPHCRGTGNGKPIDWVIVGGESGTDARPMHPSWPRALRDQCAAAGVPFLFKQWGEWTPSENVQRQTGVVKTAD